MKRAVLFLTVIFLSSCYSYIDRGKNIHTKQNDFIIKNNHNEYIYKSKIQGRNEDEVFKPRHFKIKLPKGIIYLVQVDNKLYVEYVGKQIICVKSSYLNQQIKKQKWKQIYPDNDLLENFLLDYWLERNYDVDKITKRQRITKIYTNGKFTILLYNIKKKNFDNYINFVKSVREYDE